MWTLKTEEQCFYQNAQSVIVKNGNLKQQEVRGLLSSLRIKTHLSQIPLLGPL